MVERRTWKSWLQDIIVLGFIYFVFFALVVNSTFFGTGYFTVFLVVGAFLLGTGYLLFLGLSIKIDKIYSTIVACMLIAVIAVATVGMAVLISPKWKLKLTTNKQTYSLGEDVVITATLENQGYFSQAFTSIVTSAVVISVSPESEDFYQVWWQPYSRIDWKESNFTVLAGQTLTRTFVWNQTDVHTNTTCTTGSYFVEAFIPVKDLWEGGDPETLLTGVQLRVNITIA